MPEQERRHIPSKTFDIEIRIKDLDYTNDLKKFSIISSLASSYPLFEFVLGIDPNDIILEGVFGEDPIKLSIRSVGKDEQIQEQIEMRLMLLDMDQPIDSRVALTSEEQKRRTILTFMAVPIESFKTITTNVNEVYMGMTIQEIIQDLVSKYTNATLEFDTEGANTDRIRQVVIPPTTLYKIIKESADRGKIDGYLDDQFGLYNGIPAIYCTYDNRLKVINLSRRMRKSHVLTIHQLSEGSNAQPIIERSVDGTIAYTYNDVKSTYSGNTKFSLIAKNINYITKPTTRLYNIINQDLNNVISEYGIIDRNKTVQYQRKLNNRTRYNTNHSGNDFSEVFSNSKTSSMIGGLASLEIGIERNLFIENLMNVGSVVKFDPETIEYTSLSGKYILFSSYINFSREGPDWDQTCNLRLVRSNKIR